MWGWRETVAPIFSTGGDIIRNYNVIPQLPQNGITVTELFAGGGLMACGLVAAGYNIVWANDLEKSACVAYRCNIGDHIVQCDIMKISMDDIPYSDVISGGPPCQDFSMAGTGAGEDGDRGKLVWTYMKIIRQKRPKAFIFENVKGLIAAAHRPTFDSLIEQFTKLGYNVNHKVINAWDHGVAQKRERVFIVGIRKDIGFTFEFPVPEDGDYRTQVLRDVIGDVPEPLENHKPLPLSERVSEKLEAGGYDAYLAKQPINILDAPSYAVTSHFYKGAPNGMVYLDNKPRPRRFTVRECLRIQSVPDSYVLPPEISLSAQYRIVGNGVASRVSYILGVALAEQLVAQSSREVVAC